MPLNKPTPGELVDRMGILNLKRKAAAAVVPAIEEEYAWCLELLEGWKKRNPSAFLLPVIAASLDSLNEQVWKAVDLVHVLPDNEVQTLAKLAKEIAALNDHRNRVIHQINDLFGAGASSERKFYSHNPIAERSAPVST